MKGGWAPSTDQMSVIESERVQETADAETPEKPLARVTRLTPPMGSPRARDLAPKPPGTQPKPPCWRQPCFWVLVTLQMIMAGVVLL